MYVICNLREHTVFCGYKQRQGELVPSLENVKHSESFFPAVFKHFADAVEAGASLSHDLVVITLEAFANFYAQRS